MTTEHVSNLVVGSGFGGSTVAFRLAEAGQAVTLLERGKAYPPGSFPRTPEAMGKSFWDPSKGLHGMFDVWTFDNLDAVVASGLGGGSLIYANVLLRKDPHWFVDPAPTGGGHRPWPISYEDLEPHYDHAEAMLAPQHLPRQNEAYQLEKTALLEDAAARAGKEWKLVPLAVRFANDNKPAVVGEELTVAPYGNLHGLPRRTCRLCGECDIGCNDGSKNTLDHTYLSAAQHHGADIRTRCEVRAITKQPDGRFEVTYVRHEEENEGRETNTRRLPEQVITTDRLVMGAGSLGSTYLLMKNRSGLRGLSEALGSRMSGNGDLLGFLLNAKNSDGSPRPVRGDHGPVITSSVRIDDGDIGAYIQDAGFPSFATWLVESARPSRVAWRITSVLWHRLVSLLRRDRDPRLSGDLHRLIGSATTSSTSIPLLGMGRDIADGRYGLDRGLLSCDWKLDRSLPYFREVRKTMETLADAVDAGFTVNPTWLFRRVVTVHALGGVPIGANDREGVLDPWGEAYGVPGLWVVDGAALPGPVGPNPSLTIAAFADRAAERMIG